jgi:hypothetical protein
MGADLRSSCRRRAASRQARAGQAWRQNPRVKVATGTPSRQRAAEAGRSQQGSRRWCPTGRFFRASVLTRGPCPLPAEGDIRAPNKWAGYDPNLTPSRLTAIRARIAKLAGSLSPAVPVEPNDLRPLEYRFLAIGCRLRFACAQKDQEPDRRSNLLNLR